MVSSSGEGNSENDVIDIVLHGSRVDIEFIETAAWTFDIPVVYSEQGFTCHQEHDNVWEKNPERMTPNQGIHAVEIQRKEKQYVNEEGKWAMLHLDIWEMGLQCIEFGGGLCW